VVVPSGNLGDLTGGLLAAEAGLETRGFLAAHNANDFLPTYLAGLRAETDSPATVATWSNAMDVGAPSNFERLHAWLGPALADRIEAASIDDEATLERMRRTLDEDGVEVCPHTAVGLEALARRRAAGDAAAAGPALVLATAHPAKFPDAAREATGRAPEAPPALAALAEAPTRAQPLPADPAALRETLLHGPWPDV
jgi:threonine synthase